jgi:hypothetical protein
MLSPLYKGAGAKTKRVAMRPRCDRDATFVVTGRLN